MFMSWGLKILNIDIFRTFLDFVGYTSGFFTVIIMVATGKALAQMGLCWVLSNLVYRCHGGNVIIGLIASLTMMFVQKALIGFDSTTGNHVGSDDFLLFCQLMPAVVSIIFGIYTSHRRSVKLLVGIEHVMTYLSNINVRRGMWLLDGGNSEISVGLTGNLVLIYSPLVNNSCILRDSEDMMEIPATNSYTQKVEGFVLTCNLNVAEDFAANVAVKNYKSLEVWRVNDAIRNFTEMVNAENKLFFPDMPQDTEWNGWDYVTNVVHGFLNGFMYVVHEAGEYVERYKCVFVVAAVVFLVLQNLTWIAKLFSKGGNSRGRKSKKP